MVHSLLRVKLADGWHDTEGVTSEEDNVLGVSTDGRNLDIPDVLKWIAHTCVRRQADVIVVNDALLTFLLVIPRILNDRAKLHSIKNIWLFCARKSISLGIAATLKVENSIIVPAMLVVADESSLGIG